MKKAKGITPMSGNKLNIEVVVDPEKQSVYVKFDNFQDHEDMEDYADQLAETLPMLLYESEVLH